MYTSSTRKITEAVGALYDRIADLKLPVRRKYAVANHVIPESEIPEDTAGEQLDMFTDIAALEKQREEEKQTNVKEKQLRKALLEIKKNTAGTPS